MSTPPNPSQLTPTGSLSLTGSDLQPDFPIFRFLLSSLVYLTSVECVRGVSLCSLEKHDSPLLQGLKVAEDPLSKDPNFQTTSTTSNRNPGRELTLTAFQYRSGSQVTQRPSPFPTDVLTNYNDLNLIAPGRLVVSG